MSRYVTICHDMSGYVTICHDMSRYVTICHDMSVTACDCQGFRLSLRESARACNDCDILGSTESLASCRAQEPVTRSQSHWAGVPVSEKGCWINLEAVE